MTKKKLFIILLAAFTAAASTAAGIFAFGAGAKREAAARLETETTDIKADTETITAESEKIKEQISAVDADLSTRDTVNGYYMEYKKTHDSLTEEISSLQSKIEQLDRDIEAKKSEMGNADTGETKKGKKYSLSAGESYSCPDKIPAGRYVAEGEGQLTVLNSAGRARISQNLSVAYDHTYTFDISKGEKIRVSEDITLTGLK